MFRPVEHYYRGYYKNIEDDLLMARRKGHDQQMQFAEENFWIVSTRISLRDTLPKKQASDVFFSLGSGVEAVHDKYRESNPNRQKIPVVPHCRFQGSACEKRN